MSLAQHRRGALHEKPRGRACAHDAYNLTCKLYDELRLWAGENCQLCGVPEEKTGRPRCIDHDHNVAIWAVRGLLCKWCNVGLRADRAPTDREIEYLNRAWWRGAYPTVHPAAEPGIGTTLADWAGYPWHRTPEGWCSTSKFYRFKTYTWHHMVTQRAPLYVAS